MLACASFAGAQGPALVVLNKAEASASIISLADGRTIATMPVGDGPHEVAVSPDGKWAVAANYGGRTAGSTLTSSTFALGARCERSTSAPIRGPMVLPSCPTAGAWS